MRTITKKALGAGLITFFAVGMTITLPSDAQGWVRLACGWMFAVATTVFGVYDKTAGKQEVRHEGNR